MDVVAFGLAKADAKRRYKPAQFAPSSLPAWQRALARVRAGAGDARILCVGDSTTAGVGASATSTAGDPKSYPYQLAPVLNAYVPTAKGLGIPPTNLAASPDSRWTVGTGWTQAAYGWGQSAAYQGVASAAGSLVYADAGVLADRFDIYYLSASGNGTITATATGGSATTQNTVGASGVGKFTISAASAAASNTVTIANASAAPVFVVGIEPWLSTANRVRIGNAGVGSTTAAGWNNTGSPYGGRACVKAYAADLTIISLGLNDAQGGTPSASTFLTNVLAVAAQAQSVGSDILLLPPFPSTSAGSAPRLQYEPLYAAALATAGLPYADLYARWGQPGSATVTPWMFDSLHPSAVGYADLAQFLAVGLASV